MKNKPNDNHVAISKFLSLVLRHSPQTIHLNIDKIGWVNIDEFIQNANKYKGMPLTADLINTIV